MKQYKWLAHLFTALAILLSNVMCAVVAYNYCALCWGGQYAGYSAPPSVAFLYGIPYGIAIIICVILAWMFRRKHQNAYRASELQQNPFSHINT